MARKFLCVYYDQEESWDILKDDERGQVLSALLDYTLRGELPESIPDNAKCFWPILRNQVDENNKNYADKVQKCSIAGQKSAEKRYGNLTDVNERQRTLTDVNGCQQTLTDVGNKNKNMNKNKNNKEFVPPTKEEVRAYAKERNSIVNPDNFFDYFDAGEWKDSKGQQVLNWRQKFITWEKYNVKEAPQVNSQGKRVFKDRQDQLEHDTEWMHKGLTSEQIKEAYSRGGEPSAEFIAANRELFSGLPSTGTASDS